MDKKTINSALKVIFTGSAFFLFGTLFSKFISYLIRILIARNLGVDAYGLFSLGLMIVGFFVVFSELGLGTGIIRFVSYYRGKKDKKSVKAVLFESLKLVGPLSIILGLVLFLTSPLIANLFNNIDLILYLKILSVIIPLTVLSDLFLATISGFERYDQFTYHFLVIQKIIQVVLIAIAIYLLNLSIIAIAIIYVLSFIYLIISTLYIVNYKLLKSMKENKIKEKKIKKELLTYSWPLLFVGFFGSILGWIDSFMIGYFNTTTEVGLYNSALPIAALITLVSGMFGSFFLPVITKNYAKGKEKEIREISNQISKWYIFLVFPAFLLLITFPGSAINILFGEYYLEAQTSLIILSFGFLFLGLSFISSKLLEMVKKTKFNLINLIIVGVLDIILNIILIPIYGITGAALATTISYFIYSLIYIIESKYFFDFNPISHKFIKPVIAGIISIAIIILIKSFIGVNLIKVILMIVAFFIIYFLILLKMRGFDKEDILIIKYAEQKIGINLNFIRKFAYKYIIKN